MGHRLRWLGRKLKPIDDDRSAAQCDRMFREWLAGPYGEHLLGLEKNAAKGFLEGAAGYRTMELPVSDVAGLRELTPQLHRFSLTACPQEGASAFSDLDALPLPSAVVDVAILHHVLDYCDFPHETLKEAGRVVLPSGQLIIVGFNPLGWLGLVRWPMRLLSSKVIWQNRGLSPTRVVDWLRLLGFQCEKLVYGAYNPPFNSHSFLAKMHWLESLSRKLRLPTGNFYIIVARKQRVRPIASPQERLVNAITPKLTPETPVKSTAQEIRECQKR